MSPNTNLSLKARYINLLSTSSSKHHQHPQNTNYTRAKEGPMELVWSPDCASKAYIYTVKSCEDLKESGVAEFLSAMAAGWNSKLIVESWSRSGPVATSIGLAAAANQTGGRHVCIVSDEGSRKEYLKSLQRGGEAVKKTEVVVGEAEEVMAGLEGVDFLVVDGKRRDFVRVLRHAKLSKKGAVLTCKNAWNKSVSGFRWHGVLKKDARLVRSVILPLGQGLDMAHIGSSGSATGGDNPLIGSKKAPSTHSWIRHYDHKSGEEHLFRRH